MFTCLESKSNPFFSWHIPTRWLLTLILMFNILFADQTSVSLLVRTIDTNSLLCRSATPLSLTSLSPEQNQHHVSSWPKCRFRKTINLSFWKLSSKNWNALPSLCQLFPTETILSLYKCRFVLNKYLPLKEKNVFVLLGVVFLLCSIKTLKILNLFLLQTLLGFFWSCHVVLQTAKNELKVQASTLIRYHKALI